MNIHVEAGYEGFDPYQHPILCTYAMQLNATQRKAMQFNAI